MEATATVNSIESEFEETNKKWVKAILDICCPVNPEPPQHQLDGQEMRASVIEWTQNLHKELKFSEGTTIVVQWEKTTAHLLAGLQGQGIDVSHNVPMEVKTTVGTTDC
jgi:hypothetical protein